MLVSFSTCLRVSTCDVRDTMAEKQPNDRVGTERDSPREKAADGR